MDHRDAVAFQLLINMMNHAVVNQQHALLARQLIRRRRRRKAFWVRPWLAAERRLQYGQYATLMAELRAEDTSSFFNLMRMEPAMFDELLHRVSPRISKDDTKMRKALEPGLKLAVTLRYLASGDKYASLQYDFRVSRITITQFLPEVCRAIVAEYSREVVKCPVTRDDWREVAEQYKRRWNVPHAVGAMDGKHIAMRKPHNSGSLYRNYKGFFSIVLLALVDADYKFMWVDCGGMGHMSDAQIFNASEIKTCIEDGSIDLPPPDNLPNDDRNVPYFILADDAFALKTYLMKPYSRRSMTRSQQVLNYRISRGRRVVENAFGILANRWQCLLTTMQQKPDVVRDIVEAAICLHNLMRIRYPALQNADLDREDLHHNLIPGEWRQHANMYEVQQAVGPNRDTTEAKQMREYLKLYFNSEAGAVPWQDRMVAPEQRVE